ncbi:hypothetical protein EWM63_01705 [Pseudoduganella lutea]|uniref:Uncharacterized protein n=2 Tax=Pseudoduganella lutea TaxID=321985 RepID=A0A4P6KRZ4_9BURK|nr:hypothetical protein EWM63_01705 [Pseudoduganella lutea]
MAALRGAYPARAAPAGSDAFSIVTHDRADEPGSPVYFLAGADLLGRQFCCYDFLERYAGVRFLHPDFEHVPPFRGPPQPIATAAAPPEFRYRGLYPWNYNYDRRGLSTFCDINARFEARDWAWFERLGDWLVKNRQNTLFWFDDVFNDDALSARFPQALRRYWRERGLRQVLGLGWGSNEGRPRGGKWEALTCVDAQGRSIEEADWRKTLCPRVPEYARLAASNIAGVDFAAPEAIGTLIGYGENTWAAHQASRCSRHAGIAGDVLIERDLRQVRGQVEARGGARLPLGFVISTHGANADSPFVSGRVIDFLPRNGLVSIHTYQQDSWNHFAPVYERIQARNAREKTAIRAVHIGEVAFLCNYDIPLFRPSILRRREVDLRSVPRDVAMAHLATLNTTQYLYWLKSYQMMRWQWHKDDARWSEGIVALGMDLFGPVHGKVFAELFGRLTALDYLQPASAIPDLLGSLKEPEKIRAWTRYNPATHSDTCGFYLWAKGHAPALLDDAARNAEACLALGERLNASAGALYRRQFHDTLALTAHYHAIRIHWGKAGHALAAVQADVAANRAAHIAAALGELAKMRAARAAFDVHLGKLVNTAAGDSVTRDSIAADFVRNPPLEFIDGKIALLRAAQAADAALPDLMA